MGSEEVVVKAKRVRTGTSNGLSSAPASFSFVSCKYRGMRRTEDRHKAGDGERDAGLAAGGRRVIRIRVLLQEPQQGERGR